MKCGKCQAKDQRIAELEGELRLWKKRLDEASESVAEFEELKIANGILADNNHVLKTGFDELRAKVDVLEAELVTKNGVIEGYINVVRELHFRLAKYELPITLPESDHIADAGKKVMFLPECRWRDEGECFNRVSGYYRESCSERCTYAPNCP